MKNLKKLLILVLVFVFTLALVACSNSKKDTATTALRAQPVAAEGDLNSRILDSYTENNQNFYLIRVGRIDGSLVAVVMQHIHNGIPIDFTMSTITEQSVAEATSEVVSSSITKTESHSATVGVEFGYEGIFFSSKISAEWKGEWSESTTNAASLTTSVSNINTIINSTSASYKLTESMAYGTYRLALYSTTDIYLMVAIDKEDKSIIEEEIVAVPRSNITHALEFSENGDFNNSPETTMINIPDDYNLSLPTINLTDKPIGITKEYTNNPQRTITDSKNTHMDVSLWSTEEAIKAKEAGYRYFEITISFEGKEKNDGYQCFYFTASKWTTSFDDSRPDNDKEWAKIFYYKNKMEIPEDKYGTKLSDGWNRRTYTSNKIDINKANYNNTGGIGFWIRWGGHGAGGDTWYLRNVKVSVTLYK